MSDEFWFVSLAIFLNLQILVQPEFQLLTVSFKRFLLIYLYKNVNLLRIFIKMAQKLIF